MSDYTQRDWQNGKPCEQHSVPYCTPCFKTLVAGENPYKTVHQAQDDAQATFDALRENIMRRILGTRDDQNSFYRPQPKRNFFQDSRRRQFAASCQLANGNFLVVPVEFIIVGDENTAYKADDTEMRAILTKEHLWDIATPEWVQQDKTLTLNLEDAYLLREFQLFKS